VHICRNCVDLSNDVEVLKASHTHMYLWRVSGRILGDICFQHRFFYLFEAKHSFRIVGKESSDRKTAH
jgi:hypothetical protein